MDWQKEIAGFFLFKHRNIKFVKVLCKQIKVGNESGNLNKNMN